jgi:Phosphatidylglycerophosphate synthase
LFLIPSRITGPVPETTYKAPEVEGVLDLFFYRKIGFWLARIFAKIKMTPACVSLLAGLCGIVAGHLYYYRNLGINVAGMVLHVWANILDNADGQLARLTGTSSRQGRVIDSLADHLIFVSIYVHLTLRCLVEGASPAICLLALAAGISHAVQGAAADYYRTSYLYFVKGKSADVDFATSLRADYCALSWHAEFWQKFLIALYWNFTWQQELLSPGLKRLRETWRGSRAIENPERLSAQYRASATPMFKLWGLLMNNTRMLLLFALLLLRQPVWYFWIEVTGLNLLLAYLIQRQESMARSLIELARTG